MTPLKKSLFLISLVLLLCCTSLFAQGNDGQTADAPKKSKTEATKSRHVVPQGAKSIGKSISTPANLPAPENIINGGYKTRRCVKLSFRMIDGAGDCPDDFGPICSFEIFNCDKSGNRSSTERISSTIYVQDLGSIKNGSVCCAIKSISHKPEIHLSGLPIIIKANWKLPADFAKELQCKEVYFMEGMYQYNKNGEVTIPLKIVNHSR
jgi:hypothetical protein